MPSIVKNGLIIFGINSGEFLSLGATVCTAPSTAGPRDELLGWAGLRAALIKFMPHFPDFNSLRLCQLHLVALNFIFLVGYVVASELKEIIIIHLQL